MKVTAQNHDDVSTLLRVILEKSDYKEKVEKQLINYAKNAQIPGFRKGKVPLSMIKKQYEEGVAFEEINKQVNDAVNTYIDENKLRLIGQPVPQPADSLDYHADQIEVTFEVGYEPHFAIDLSKYQAPHYRVKASEKEINQSIENMKKRFAERISQDNTTQDSYIVLEIYPVVKENGEGENNHNKKNITISADNKKAFEIVKDLKKDESLKILKERLESDEELARELGFGQEEVERLKNEELEVKVKDFYLLHLADINQDLIDKVYGENVIQSEEEFKEKIKTELDEYFQHTADVHFVNKILEQITQKEQIKLPENFLIKWLMYSDQTIKSEEHAKEILETEKDQLRHQIIEGKLMADNQINLDYADILAQAELLIRNQFAMHGIHHLNDEEIQKYAVEILKDKQQVKQISSEVTMAKLKDIIIEKAEKKDITISHDEFLEKINNNTLHKV